MGERSGRANIVTARGVDGLNNETPVHLQRAAAASPLHQQWRWRGGLTAAYASEAGNGHAHNEDCCSHVPSAQRPGFCGVADGVGGGAHGEIASSVLLAHCAQASKETYRDPARLIDWLARADAQVREAIARRTDQAGAATLAAAWFPSQSTAYLLNVGDCRIYQLKPRKQRYAIEQLTVDQTYASFAQQPPPNGRPDDPARMVGAGAVGIPPVVKTQILERELLLLCSDGVHKFISDEQIADVVSGGLSEGSSLETICDALVRAAKRNGSHDDASALLVLRRPWFTPRWAYGCALAGVLLLCFSLVLWK
jgi:serine/threonine protein phosphatase PrpC